MTYNRYWNTASLYDQDERAIVQDDIPFYLELADRCQGAILELGCGTGRVTLSLIRAGHEVWGLDYSQRMLAQLSRKLSSCSHEVRSRLHLLEADMSDFRLPIRFRLIFIPFRSFQLLTDPEQAAACLECVRDHLTDDGWFALHLFKPYGVLDESWIAEEREDWSRTDPETGARIRRTQTRGSIDVSAQIIYPTHTYYVSDSSGTESTYVEELAMKYYYEDQIQALLSEAKLDIVQQFGYFDRRPVEEGTELIYLCKKRGA